MTEHMQVAVGILRGVMAGLLLALFVGLWLWAFGTRRRQSFESASRLPLEEDRFGEPAQ